MFGIWYVCNWVSPFSLLIVRDKLHFHHEAVLRTKEIKMPNIISFCLFCFQDLIKMWSDEIRVASHIEAKAHEEDDHEDGAADSFCPLFPFLMMKHNCVHFWRFICHMIYIVNINFRNKALCCSPWGAEQYLWKWFCILSNVKVHIALHYSSCSPLPCCPLVRQDQTWPLQGSRTCAPKHSPYHFDFQFHFDSSMVWQTAQHMNLWLQTKKLNWPH